MSRRKGKKSKAKNFKQNSKPRIPDTARNIILAGLFLFLALFFLLSFFKLAGFIGRFSFNSFNQLFGRTIYIFPVLFILAGIVFLSSKLTHKKIIIISLIFFLIGLSGFLATLDAKISSQQSFAYSANGGWLGAGISWPLLKAFGFWVVEIIYLIVCLATIFLTWKFLRPAKEKKEIEEKEISVKSEVEKKFNIKKVFAPNFKVKNVDEPLPVVLQPKQDKALQLKPNLIPGPAKIAEGGKLPPLDLLEADKDKATAGDIETSTQIIKRTLENFGINVEMSGVSVGPTVTQYTFKPAEGIKLSKITALNNNLALALAAHPIRIEAPIPGKSLVGIEVPNQIRAMVRLRNLIGDPEFQSPQTALNFVAGRDVIGTPVFADLAKMPHLLVAGSTGTGKTIGLNSILLSLLYNHTPATLRLILIDPKRVEFSAYNDLPHLLGPVVFDANKTVGVLRWLIGEMEKRFEMLSEVGARNINFYNAKIDKNGRFKKEGLQTMPYIVLVIDELADLMAARGRDVEAGIVRLAQKARAVGIHLLLATQRPSVEVITGLIKANIIARMAFQVASHIDSRTILDSAGAEKLLGNGDMLFLSSVIAKPRRVQGAYVAEKEVLKVTEFIAHNQSVSGIDELSQSLEEALEKPMLEDGSMSTGGYAGDDDPLYEEAKRLVLETKKASASFLQRRLRVGYARAARLLDILEDKGVIGSAQGAKARDVFGGTEEEIEGGAATFADDKDEKKGFGKDYNEEID